MGQHHILLDEKGGVFIDMGKRTYGDNPKWFYQMPEHAIVKFIHSRASGSVLKLTTDSSADDYAYDNREIDTWNNYCK